MSAVSNDQIQAALKEYIDPHTDKDLVSSRFVKDIAVDGGKVKVTVELGYPAQSFKDKMAADLKALVEAIDGVDSADIEISWKIAAHAVQKNVNAIEGVKDALEQVQLHKQGKVSLKSARELLDEL